MQDEGAIKAKRPDRRVLRTRKALFEAFERLLREKDCDKITISELAAEADVDRKTFYLHYRSIDDLLDDRVDAIVAEILDEVEKDMHARSRAGAHDAKPDLQVFFAEVDRVVKACLPMRDHILSAMPAGALADKLSRPLTAEIMRRGMKLDVDEDMLEVCVSSVVGAILGAYGAWLKRGMDVPVDRVSGIARRMVAAALREFSASSQVG